MAWGEPPCFHNDDGYGQSATGYCMSTNPQTDLWVSVQADNHYSTQYVTIDGQFKDKEDTLPFWLSGYLVTKCKDFGPGKTYVEGKHYATDELLKFTFTADGYGGPHHETGTATIEFTRNGKVIKDTLSCFR
jgi:hypothetical protein